MWWSWPLRRPTRRGSCGGARRRLRAIPDAMARLKAEETFYGTELGMFTAATIEPSTLHEFWLSAGELYAVPPRGSHEGAVAALSLYAEEAANENLDALAR